MKGKRILDWILPLALSSLLPLSLLHSELFFTNNYFITVALLFLLMLVCLWKIIAKSSIKITLLDILLVSVFAISVLSSFVNQVSFNATFNIKFVLYAAIFLLMKNVLSYKKTVLCFYVSVIATNLFILVFVAISLVTQSDYVHFFVSKFGNTGVAAIYLAISSVFLLHLLRENFRRKRYYTLFLLVVPNIGLMLLLQSRISVVLVIVYLLFAYLPQMKRIKPKMGVVVAIVIAVLAFAVLALGTKRDSTEGRFLILKISSKIIAENPLIGSGGFNSFSVVYPLQQAEYFTSANRPEKEIMLADNMQFALNEPVQFVCEVGTIGLILILLIAYKLIKRLKINHTLRITLLAILFASCFSYILRITVFQNLFFILLMIAGMWEKSIVQLKSKAVYLILCPIWIASLFFVNCLVSKYTESLILRHRIENKFNFSAQSPHTVEKFKDNPTFLFQYARQVFNRGDYSRCLEVLNALTLLLNHSDIEFLKAECYKFTGKWDKAEKHFISASNMCPNRFKYRYELFKLYLEREDLEKTINVALSIRNLNEKIPSTYTLAVKLEIERFLTENNVE
jgi:hypothetical protein